MKDGVEFEGKETVWDRDARSALSAMIRQTPLAQLPGVAPSILSAAAEFADALAVKRKESEQK